MPNDTKILFPVGRLVQGSLYRPQLKDMEGRPLLDKNGQPRPNYVFSVAVKKTQPDWKREPWGSVIEATATTAFPQGQHRAPDFAYKVKDGDSTIPNIRGRINANSEGFAGCWIVKFSSGFAPRLYNANGSAPLAETEQVKLGYYVQVYATVSGNNSATKPGVYLNHSMVAFSGFGPEIVTGPDATAVGFGGGALPAGASAAPVAQFVPPVTLGTQTAAQTVAATPAPTAVQPHPGFLNVPPPAPPAATWKGPTGTTQAQYAQAGWTVEQMRAGGLLV